MSERKISINLGPSGGFLGLLFLVFLVLKLTHTIDWSWWWVTCPLWAGLAIWGTVVGLILVVGLFVGLLKMLFNR